MSGPTLDVRVKSITWEAERINTYELTPLGGVELPSFKAGSHIDVHLPHGATRSYSLVNAEGETHRYVIGVALDAASAGGSRYMHENVKPGDRLAISPPANNFVLDESAPLSVLIAGGIGVTPIYCMVQRLTALGRPWQLHYSARTREVAAFADALAARGAASGNLVNLNFDCEPGGTMLDLGAIVGAAPADAHLYCCGPTGMLEAFERAAEKRPREQVHVEYFSAKEDAARAGGFTVVLAKTNRTVFVEEGRTILEALLDAGMDPAHSCMEGVCGTCETRVLEGVPDHRDLVLSDAEKAGNKTMMICCSGAKTPTLVLDL
jgi:vanillate O-demethylase ferredoxin subunit